MDFEKTDIDENMRPFDAVQHLKKQLCRQVLGQDLVIERVLISLLCDGNLLVEGLPGTAKTRVIKSLAQQLDASLGRIQFTPDLLPSDVTGTEVYHHEKGRDELVFQPGPLFNNLVLADEINRAPAKVQAALLESMEERQVTVAGCTHKLPQLFMVLATQNPIEQEGTYPLPEAQIDRFLMKVRMAFPNDDAEREIMHLMRQEEGGSGHVVETISQQKIFAAREQISQIYMSSAIDDYIIALIMTSRKPSRYSEELANQIEVGASSRASIALDRCSRAHAWLQGRDYVEPDDVRAVVTDVLRHRLILSYEAQANNVDADQVIAKLVSLVPVV